MDDDKKNLSSDKEEEEFPQYIFVKDVLDLHGFFPEQAVEMVEEFLNQAIDLNLDTVRIIHGKGRSKMKWTIYQVLKQHPAVEQFHDAPPEAGGWGATVVRLKKS